MNYDCICSDELHNYEILLLFFLPVFFLNFFFFFISVIMTLIHMKYAIWTFLEMSVSCITLEWLCGTSMVIKFHKFLFSVGLSWDIAVESEFCFCSLCGLVCMTSLLKIVLITGTAVRCMVLTENRTETSSFYQALFTAANSWLLKLGLNLSLGEESSLTVIVLLKWKSIQKRFLYFWRLRLYWRNHFVLHQIKCLIACA